MAMNAQLKRIVGLMGTGSVEESIAAAMVLGALAPGEKAVVDALAANLGREDNLPLALASARALGRIGNAAALKALVPLLTADGDLRDTGALAVAGCGAAALPAVQSALAGAGFDGKRVLYEILARMHTAGALRLALQGFFEPNFEMVKAVSRALRAEAPALTATERKAATATALAFLRSKPVRESRGAVNSTLIYLGALARTDAVPALLEHTAPGLPRSTRRHALVALKAVLQGEAPPATVVAGLFPYLDDPDFENVVDPSLGVLERARLPAAYDKDLERLVGGRTPPVRAFAVRKLAETSGKRGAEILVQLLDGGDEQIRRSAVFALKNSGRAPALLLPRLLAEKDPDRVWELVHLVKPNAPSLTPAEVRKLGAAAVAALDKADRRGEALLHLFRAADPAVYYRTFLDRAAAARKARRYGEAERNLRLISRDERFDAEARFRLHLMTLLDAGKKATPESPKVQQAVRGFRGLAEDAALDLEARFRKEARAVGPEGIYLVGFGLLEETGAVKLLGAKFLRSLVKKGASTKLGRMARAKLQTEGLA